MLNLRRLFCYAVLLSTLTPPASAATVELVGQEISVGLSYFMGWGPETFEDAARSTSNERGPIDLSLGAEASGEYATFGEQRVATDLEASGTLDFNAAAGETPVFSAALQGSISLLAVGNLATALGLVPLPENYAYFDFDVSGEDAEYSISFSETVDSGFLRLRGLDNFVLVTLGDTRDRVGTLAEGSYRVEAFYSLGDTASDTQPATFPNGGIQFTMTFPGSVFEPGPEPEPQAVPISPGFSILLGAMLTLVGSWSLRRAVDAC